MGTFTDYYLAVSDREAAALLNQGPRAGGVPFAESKWIDGVVTMATLEGILTDSDPMAIINDGTDPVVAMKGDDGPWIIRIRDQLVLALAGVGDRTIRQTAEAWAATEELAGLHNSESLSAFLENLQPLCRHAIGRSQHLYCWMCL